MFIAPIRGKIGMLCYCLLTLVTIIIRRPYLSQGRAAPAATFDVEPL